MGKTYNVSKLSENDIRDILPDNYEFVKILGRGGFNLVLLCKLPDLDEIYAAVKINQIVDGVYERIKEKGGSYQLTKRQGKLIEYMRYNPFTPNLIWIERRENVVILCEELIKGETLDQFLEKKPDYKSLCEITRNILRGFSLVHKYGIVHCDIKPDNIMIEEGNSIKIVDFNLYTFTGDPLFLRGYSPYRAPEIFEGQPIATPTIDAWSLGIMLYQMFTGELPFESDIKDWKNLSPAECEEEKRILRQRVTTQDLYPAQLINPEIGNDIAQLLEKALNKNPKERYQNAEQMQRNWLWLRHKYKAYAALAALGTTAVTLSTKI